MSTEQAGAPTIVGELERLGLAVEYGVMTEQEAVRLFLQVARIMPGPAAVMIKDWRGAVAAYEEWGRQVAETTGKMARAARGHFYDATGHEDTLCTCPSPGTYAPQAVPCADGQCGTEACPEHPAHIGGEHTYEMHHHPVDHVGFGSCRCIG